MDTQKLDQKEAAITGSYQKFLDKVREAFNVHCEEIKDKATERFNAIPEGDDEARQRILEEQKAELDQALSELKQLLAKRGAEVRHQLEEIADLKEQGEFSLDSALSEVAEDETQHVA